MQYADDTALADALGRTQRYITARVEFDWNRNGRFDHPYSDLSAIVTHVESDRQMTGDLPETVNTMIGYSSAEMACTLAGRRAADELSAPGLFSPYEPESPLYGYRVPNTPVRYSRVVQTDDGERVVRQFTGWVRSLDISRDNAEVKITAQDNVDISQSSVTLPRWARINTGNPAAYRPIDTTWVVEEVLRQAGRPTGPVERDDALVYVTCNGAFLPSVGHVGDDYQIPLRRHYVTNEVAEPFTYENTKYGASAPVLNTGASGGNGFNPDRRNGASISAARTIDANQNVTIGVGMWVYSDGSSTGYGGDYFAAVGLQLEDWPRTGAPTIADEFHQYGALVFGVYANGTVDMTVWENIQRTATDRRQWQWRRTTRQPEGWHYMAVQVTFGSSVTAAMWVDDASTALTTVQSSTGRYRRYVTTGAEWARTNLCQLIVNIPAQHVQVWGGPTSSTQYRPGQQHAPTTADGLPLARATASLSELGWIPDVTMRHGWTVLQELANAEFGVVYTDEHGVINYVSHPFLRMDAEAGAASPLMISDDVLLGFTVNPTTDQYRNTISMSYSDRWATRALVWKAENPWDYWMHATPQTSPQTYNIPLADDVISVFCYNLPRITEAQAQNGGENIYTGGSAAITWTGIPQFPTTTSACPGAWSATTFATQVPREFRLQAVSPSAPATFAFLPGNEAALFLGGTRYSAEKYVRRLYRDDDEVAARGERLLELDDNPWRQTIATAAAISRELLADTTVPAPLIDGVSIPSDPRLQLRDIVRIHSEGGVTESLFAQVIGITRTDSTDGGSVDKLTMRVIVTPGEWILDDPTLSVLDDTTILA